MRALLTTCALMLVAVPFATAADIVHLDMDKQINLGLTNNSQSPNGDAIYQAFTTNNVTFGADEPEGYTRLNITQGGGWYYLYNDLNLAGVGEVNLTGGQVQFDARYFQDPETNSGPYGDAPIFLRLYTYADDGNTYVGHRDYSIVYATQPNWSNPPYPTWTNVTVNVDSTPHTDGGAFDVTQVSRVRWYGTDWKGTGGDFVDVKNLELRTAAAVPEPGTYALLASGLIGLLPFARRRK